MSGNDPLLKSSESYRKLRQKWAQRHSSLKERLWSKHKESLDWIINTIPGKQHITAGSLTGLLLLAPLISGTPASSSAQPEPVIDISSKSFLIAELASVLPQEVRPLEPQEEEKIGELLTTHAGFSVKAELEGKRLNRSYGVIGAEQHLMRYPGDTMSSHFTSNEEAVSFAKSGMAPGRGAWGYFAPSFSEMTPEIVNREKYYIAVQTFLAPGFNDNVREHYEFYKYRKMLVVNPQNGRAVVVVVGDAGPAAWTGKHLGGSPEVMAHLKRVDGRARGAVLYFFIDDPENIVPLGPIEL